MKKIWKYLFLIVINIIMEQSVLTAQNLIPNGSFEHQYSCPSSTNQVDTCINWHRIINTPFDLCSPDYFDTCSPYPVSIPSNFTGEQFTFDGHAYMGLYTYTWNTFYREIIGTQLLDTMASGSTYHISMRVSRGNWTNQAYNCSASNKLGMRFTTYAYLSTDTPTINNYAQVYTDSIIEDTLNWVLLDWNYTSDSAYTHVYLGNFFDDANTDTTIIAAPVGQFGHAYYFIDSVNIVCTSTNCFTGINENPTAQSNISYDLNSKIIYFGGLRGMQNIFFLYNEIGQEIINQNVKDNEQINISEKCKGFYVAVLQSGNKTAFKKIIKY